MQRAILLIAVMITVIGAGAVPAVATDVTAVTVEWSDCNSWDPGSLWDAGGSGRLFVEDQVISCEVEASNPRVSGTETTVLDLNWVASPVLIHPARVPFSGSWRLVNDDGYWEGRVTGYLEILSWDPLEYLHVGDVTGRGYDDYAGMQYRAHMEEYFGTGSIRPPGWVG